MLITIRYPDPPTMGGRHVKLVVAFNMEHALFVADRAGIDLRSRRSPRVVLTDSAPGPLAYGMTMSEDDVFWVPGWTAGKFAEEVALLLVSRIRP